MGSAGNKRAAPRKGPRGRMVLDTARAEIQALLGDAPRRRDLLIEHLHRIQDRYGHLSAAHLAALAEEMRLPQAAIYEVATFYAHFDIVREGEAAPPPVTIRICDGLSCSLAGGDDLLRRLSALYAGSSTVRVVRAPCMGRCDQAPVAEIGHFHQDKASVETVREAADEKRVKPTLPDYEPFERYRDEGGYHALEALRGGARSPEALQKDIEASGLRGLGGAGFPAHRKWGFVRAEAGPRYLAVNGDEGEPGTFKDRYYLEREPHLFLEGALTAAWAIEAQRCYLYIRDEYPAVLEILRREIAALESAGIAEPGYLELRRGAGAYICGEESAMLESIEGKRGLPRHRPPYVAQQGLFGRPTLVHNVETLYWIAKIARGQTPDGMTLRSYSVSGRVRYPGVKLAPAGISARRLIEEHCGGMADGHAFKAYLPGGASGGILPESLADLPLDFGALEPYGGFIGSAAVIVLSDQDSARLAALNLLEFFKSESCGQCTPCRVGCEKAATLMQAERWDAPLLEELCRTMEDASICGLGQAAPNPIRHVMKHFPEEI